MKCPHSSWEVIFLCSFPSKPPNVSSQAWGIHVSLRWAIPCQTSMVQPSSSCLHLQEPGCQNLRASPGLTKEVWHL